MAKVVMYSSALCFYCMRARRLLERKGVAVEVVSVDAEPERFAEMVDRSGRHTVPQIFVGGQHVGGCDDLYALERDGRLDPLLGRD